MRYRFKSVRCQGLLCALASAGALAACSDGYPTKQSALMLQHGMSAEKAMDAMNELGHLQPSAFHWHYRLLPGCVLEVHARRWWDSRSAVLMPLREADILQTREEGTGEYRIALASRSEPSAVVEVLDHMDEADASQLAWLLRYLPGVCAQEAQAAS